MPRDDAAIIEKLLGRYRLAFLAMFFISSNGANFLRILALEACSW